MDIKKCGRCKELKPLHDFSNDKSCKNGKASSCKQCLLERRKKNQENAREATRQWRKENPDKVSEQSRRWRNKNLEKNRENARQQYNDNPEKAKEYNKRRYNENSEKQREKSRQQYNDNPEKAKEYNRRRRNENLEKAKEKESEYSRRWRKKNPQKDRERALRWRKKNREKIIEYARRPQQRIVNSLRSRVREVLKLARVGKYSNTFNLIGCDINFFMGWFEKKFKVGMTWDNFGKWHIDHIIPCASFDFVNDLTAQKQCFHYTNLQPLWASENMSKGKKIIKPAELSIAG